MTAQTNLQVMEPSPREPRVGDIFAMQLPDGSYLHGRVIATDALAGPSMPGSNLVYLYSERSPTEAAPDSSALKPDRLLVPPLMTNRMPWKKGYFKTIANRALEPADVLPAHCFEDVRGYYYDEYSNRRGHRTEPCGDWGLHSYLTIDDAVSQAVGIMAIES
jgi:hypothetical protein